MILAENPRLYPVYTWHAEEVMHLDRRVYDLLRRRSGNDESEKTDFLRDLHRRLDRVFQQLKKASGAVAYLEKDDRVLVEKVVRWLQQNPDDRNT